MSLFLSALPDPASFLRNLASSVPSGAVVVASTFNPDVETSVFYVRFLDRLRAGSVDIPPGFSKDSFLTAVRDYMNSAAWLVRLAEEGTFHFFSEDEFQQLFVDAGFTVLECHRAFGPPHQATMLRARR